MNIALIGYGKMGRVVEGVAQTRGHQIVLRVNRENQESLTPQSLGEADVAIEFTGPGSATDNLRVCAQAGIATVCGSTGWLDDLPMIESLFLASHGSFLHASNFSIGVNLFFQLNVQLARLMCSHPAYLVDILETHHTQKKDAPSGTALTLAGELMKEIPGLKKWVNGPACAGELSIRSDRVDPTPGTHIVSYRSEMDEIRITHEAKNRNGFAEGALLAAEYIFGRRGIFTMKEVLGL